MLIKFDFVSDAMASVCSLCSLETAQNPILEGMHTFCCPGCHAVFNILSTRNQLHHFQDHPLFQQAVKSGLISNPVLLESIGRTVDRRHGDEWEKLHLEIQEMWCPSCAEIIKLILMQEKRCQAMRRRLCHWPGSDRIFSPAYLQRTPLRDYTVSRLSPRFFIG